MRKTVVHIKWNNAKTSWATHIMRKDAQNWLRMMQNNEQKLFSLIQTTSTKSIFLSWNHILIFNDKANNGLSMVSKNTGFYQILIIVYQIDIFETHQKQIVKIKLEWTMGLRAGTKELSFCHKLWFWNLYFCATRCCRPLIFQTMNSV